MQFIGFDHGITRNHRRPRVSMPTLLSLLLCAGANIVRADTTIYSNLEDDGGVSFYNVASASSNTNLVADDIHFIPTAVGDAVNAITFSVGNEDNDQPITVSPTLEVFTINGANKPGGLLTAVTLPTITIPIGTRELMTINQGTYFTVPANDGVFAGLYFSSTTASIAQLDSLSQMHSDVPSVGSSMNSFFDSSGPGTMADNPPGNLIAGNDLNLSWAFSTAVPEPSGLVAVAIGSLGGLRWAARRRRNR